MLRRTSGDYGSPVPHRLARGRTVFGGGAFIVCVALGLGAVLIPLRIQLPRGVLVGLAAPPVLAGIALIGDKPRVWPAFS